MSKNALNELFNKYRDAEDPADAVWTEENRRELDRLKTGDIDSLKTTAIFGRAVEANDAILVEKLMVHPPQRRSKVLQSLFEKLTLGELNEILSHLHSTISIQQNQEDVSLGNSDPTNETQLLLEALEKDIPNNQEDTNNNLETSDPTNETQLLLEALQKEIPPYNHKDNNVEEASDPTNETELLLEALQKDITSVVASPPNATAIWEHPPLDESIDSAPHPPAAPDSAEAADKGFRSPNKSCLSLIGEASPNRSFPSPFLSPIFPKITDGAGLSTQVPEKSPPLQDAKAMNTSPPDVPLQQVSPHLPQEELHKEQEKSIAMCQEQEQEQQVMHMPPVQLLTNLAAKSTTPKKKGRPKKAPLPKAEWRNTKHLAVMDKKGTYIRPAGRGPGGYEWNSQKGMWHLKTTEDKIDS
jgi:hypothetical protein